MLRKTALVASALVIVGIIGSVLTFKSAYRTEEIREEKVIQDAFEEIRINAEEAKVEVLPGSDAEAKVELTGNGSNTSFSANVDDQVLKVNVSRQEKKLFNYDFTRNFLTLKVYVPDQEYKAIQAETGNSSIHLHDLHIRDVNVITDNGRIKIEQMQSDSVAVEADNGMITMKNVIAEEAEASADNGKIHLDNVTGKLAAETDNGSISLLTEDMDRPVDFQTDNGQITIQTEKRPTNVMFDVRVENGKIDIFGEKDWNTVIGDGENLIKLTAENGRISVK